LIHNRRPFITLAFFTFDVIDNEHAMQLMKIEPDTHMVNHSYPHLKSAQTKDMNNFNENVNAEFKQGEGSAFSTSLSLVPNQDSLEQISEAEEQEHVNLSNNTTEGGSQDQYDRTAKVAKIKYTDHGSHGVVVKPNLLQQMTTSLDVIYQQSNSSEETATTANQFNTHDEKQIKKRLSPYRESSSSSSNTNTNIESIPHKQKPSLLHAALQQNGISHHSPEKQPSTKDDGATTGTDSTIPRECLTNPSEPVSNYNLDNIEGNLIVCKNDLIRLPNNKINKHKSKTIVSNLKHSDPLGISTFIVLDLLGQGTFAQVFKCKNVETGQLCAVKIVKNKTAYTRQAAIEIDIFLALAKDTPNKDSIGIQLMDKKDTEDAKNYMVSLLSNFMYKSHLCLVFELLGLNLYEVLKRRQFRGLPISVVRNLVKQAVDGTNVLTQKNIVHCDLKPENILVVSDEAIEDIVNSGENGKKGAKNDSGTCTRNFPNGTKDTNANHKIKLIDFGSACFEGQAAHTYIQSRFYRSPEVLIGIDYDAAIDMWSLGCVAAELFLGLPILPGIHEHDQLGRISEMIGKIPDWMLEQGKKTSKYFVLDEPKLKGDLNIIQARAAARQNRSWRMSTREEFINSLSAEEIERYGGQSKLEQQPTNRYFKKKSLGDIVMHHGHHRNKAETESLMLFVHFLKGILNPDPCERWTAFQASSHPFLTGITHRRRSISIDDPTGMGKGRSIINDIHWSTPWDPSVCRRILSLKRNSKRSSPSNLHKSLESQKEDDRNLADDSRSKKIVSPTSRVTSMASAMSISLQNSYSGRNTPPVHINLRASHDSGMQPSFHTASSSIGSLPLHMMGANMQPPSNLSMSLREHFDSTDAHIVSDQIMIPPMRMSVGAQSYSGAYHSNITPGLQGDLGYALQRPGVMPGSGIGHHVNQVPPMNSMYIQMQPTQHHPNHPMQMGHFLRSSSLNSSDLGHYSSNSYTGVPTHLSGPMSPPSHALNMPPPQDRFQDSAYTYQSQHGHMPPSFQYPMYLHDNRSHMEFPPSARSAGRRGSSWSNY